LSAKKKKKNLKSIDLGIILENSIHSLQLLVQR
jgi:hypothetical protein